MAPVDPDVTYPRDVPAPDGVPPGWKGVEKAYGENSKMAGTTYIRYSSTDGRYNSVGSVKGIYQKHCEDNGLDFTTVYNKYLDHEREQKEAKHKEREELGSVPGVKRDEMVALSRATFGELRGTMVFSFPGWKTRWEFQPSCNQVMKAFTEPSGREWLLLMNLECYFGHQLEKGGDSAAAITALIEEGKRLETPENKALYGTGVAKAREVGGVYEIDPSTGETQMMDKEGRDEFKKAKAESKKEKKEKTLHDFSDNVYPPQVGWASLSSKGEIMQGFTEFRRYLTNLSFQPQTELVAVHGLPAACRFGLRITGIYYQMPAPVAERSCYQKLLHAPDLTRGVCCDGIYIVWNSLKHRWQICSKPSEDAPCLAYCEDGSEEFAKVPGPWKVQTGNADFNDTPLTITAA